LREGKRGRLGRRGHDGLLILRGSGGRKKKKGDRKKRKQKSQRIRRQKGKRKVVGENRGEGCVVRSRRGGGHLANHSQTQKRDSHIDAEGARIRKKEKKGKRYLRESRWKEIRVLGMGS